MTVAPGRLPSTRAPAAAESRPGSGSAADSTRLGAGKPVLRAGVPDRLARVSVAPVVQPGLAVADRAGSHQ